MTIEMQKIALDTGTLVKKAMMEFKHLSILMPWPDLSRPDALDQCLQSSRFGYWQLFLYRFSSVLREGAASEASQSFVTAIKQSDKEDRYICVLHKCRRDDLLAALVRARCLVKCDLGGN